MADGAEDQAKLAELISQRKDAVAEKDFGLAHSLKEEIDALKSKLGDSASVPPPAADGAKDPAAFDPPDRVDPAALGSQEDPAAFDPHSFGPGDCCKITGLTSEAGKLLNDQVVMINMFIEDNGRFEVRFVPEKTQNMKPDNLRKLSEKERLDSLLTQLLAAIEEQSELVAKFKTDSVNKAEFEGKLLYIFGEVYQRHAVDLGWQLAILGKYGDEELNGKFEKIKKLVEYGSLGPLDLDKNDIVEVTGLQSDSGKLMNGQKGRVMKFDEEKERYEIRFVPEKFMNIKAENLKPLDFKERTRAVMRDLLEAYSGKRIAKQLQIFINGSTNKSSYGQNMLKLQAVVTPPIFDRYCIDDAWLRLMLGTFVEDEEIMKMAKMYGDIMLLPKWGPMSLTKGDFMEIFGLESEAGKKMNGMAVAVKAWNEQKGRYDVTSVADPEDVKAIKPDNLKAIEDKFLEYEEALEFQRELTEAYKTDKAKQLIADAKAKYPNMMQYMAMMKPLCMELQRDVLEKYGFRTDYVGQSHLKDALGKWEAVDPSFLARNCEMEALLGLPPRSVGHS